MKGDSKSEVILEMGRETQRGRGLLRRRRATRAHLSPGQPRGLYGDRVVNSLRQYDSRCHTCIDGAQTTYFRCAIHSRTSSTRHAVTPADSLTGAGNSPARTLRHSVVGENGIIPRMPLLGLPTRSVCRTKPRAGSPTGDRASWVISFCSSISSPSSSSIGADYAV